MSTKGNKRPSTPEAVERAVRRYTWCFVALLLLSATWPVPAVALVEGLSGRSVEIPPRSFLGHEPPVWDAAFWAIAGSFLISIISNRVDGSRKRLIQVGKGLFAIPRGSIREVRESGFLRIIAGVLAGGIAAILVAVYADEAFIALVASFDSSWYYPPFRIANRLSGGANPGLIVAFVAVCGIYLGRERWLRTAVAMLCAGLAGGLLVRALKQGVARARPELWIGPFKTADPGSGSFPSGHTMSAFVIAGVIWFSTESKPIRAGAAAIALMVAFARVLNFRHWPSDVLASALLGIGFAWFFVRVAESGEQ